MQEIDVLSGLAATPIIVALVAAAGMAVPRLPRRLYPAVAMLLGVAWAVATNAAAGTLAWDAVLEGIVAGLAASGLYSGAVKPLGEAANRRLA